MTLDASHFQQQQARRCIVRVELRKVLTITAAAVASVFTCVCVRHSRRRPGKCSTRGAENIYSCNRLFASCCRVHIYIMLLLYCEYAYVHSRFDLLRDSIFAVASTGLYSLPSLSFTHLPAIHRAHEPLACFPTPSRSLLELRRGRWRLRRRRRRPASQPVQDDEAALLLPGVFGDRGVRVPVHQ